MKRERIVIAGGSGFLGAALEAQLIEAGHDVVILTRAPRNGAGPNDVYWDGRTIGEWASLLDGAAAVVNFAGRNVNCRYHKRNRREILDSRLDSVAVIGKAIKNCRRPPPVWIQSATLAIYGHAGEAELDETATPADGFSPEVAKQWEQAFLNVQAPATRKVVLRISFVIGRSGGALKTLAALTRSGLGGAVGNGRQWMSWLHVEDLNRIILRAIEDHSMEGMYHATSPNPERNRDFMREMRRVLRRPWSPPVPRWALPVGTFLMRTESELIMRSRHGIPGRLLDEGFEFNYPDLGPALDSILGTSER
ncbi:MAG: TIGR01777 family oxidoreductase [Verrucomicrobia bacterium]|nr:TIGR01777 family oxidoreductase [Verrucomicrobiota bacterium]MDA1087736.1 TIGR01777 family oxidoreductase [Verrucomicrobiota bacterium]